MQMCIHAVAKAKSVRTIRLSKSMRNVVINPILVEIVTDLHRDPPGAPCSAYTVDLQYLHKQYNTSLIIPCDYESISRSYPEILALSERQLLKNSAILFVWTL